VFVYVLMVYMYIQSRDISVGVVTGYGLDGPGSIPVAVKDRMLSDVPSLCLFMCLWLYIYKVGISQSV
jgi:hypothetical protein